MTWYVVRRGYWKKLWIPFGGLRWPPPRLLQLMSLLTCAMKGHDWGAWACDDYEGPGEQLDPDNGDSFMPYLSRDARDGEWAHRHCQRRCGASEDRIPLRDAGPMTRGKVVWM